MKICYTFSELRDWLKKGDKPLLLKEFDGTQYYAFKASSKPKDIHMKIVRNDKTVGWMPRSEWRAYKREEKAWRKINEELERAVIWGN